MSEKENKPTPQVTPTMFKAVSDHRRASLEGEVQQGLFKDGTAARMPKYEITSAGNVIGGGMKKEAQESTQSAWRSAAAGDTINQIPEVYSPLWLNSNLNLPRDRGTINMWCRSFFALNPVVHNAINLHSTYPISKLNIRCPHKKIEDFFNEMIEEIDLMNIVVQMAQEYWLLGEAIVYADLDENTRKWSRLIIQNPDYIALKRSVVPNEPSISLIPDNELKRIVNSNKSSDMEQRNMLNDTIITHIRRGENIPLDNFNVSYLSRKIAPYDPRGTGLPVTVFRQLMLLDKIREAKFAQADNMINPLTLVKIGGGDNGYKPTAADLEVWRDTFACHDEETEVLTSTGFKKFNEVEKNEKIACFNPETEQLEYEIPLATHSYDYNGKMYHFANEKIDLKVTPNHKLYVSKKEYEYNGHRSLRKEKWGTWNKIEAKDLKITDTNRFRSQTNWIGNNDIKTVNVAGNEVPIELYLEFIGYFVSEGCTYKKKSTHAGNISICQSMPKFQKEMRDCAVKFANACKVKLVERIYERKEKNHSTMWSGSIYDKDITNFFKAEFGINGNTKNKNKIVPRWILDLNPELLNIFVTAAVKGDGSIYPRKDGNTAYAYYSTSKNLADSIYEAAYKCGYVPIMFERKNRPGNRMNIHNVLWSTTNKGNFPLVYKTSRNSETKVKKELLKIEDYNGKVWCYTTKTGLFITRRNGKITIQGNSGQYNKDYKIFTHEAVTVERVGYNSGILDTSNDITQLWKEIYAGLMVPSVVVEGGGDTTYANGGVALDVLRNRYMSFRNMLSSWLRRKIFAPISKINEFYEFKDKKKILIVPEVDWNHMSLFDAGDYTNNLVQLADKGVVAHHTVYRSLGLEYEEEQRKLRKQRIAEAIAEKEKANLKKMSLNELRAISDDDEIPEVTESPLPGESPYDTGGAGGGESSEPSGDSGGGLPPMPGGPQ